jgi:hypothetical protein
VIRALLAFVTGLLGFAIRFAAALIRLGVHHPLAGLITLAVFIAAVLFRKTVLGRHSRGWRRARSIRFRLWLWLRPGAGFASLPELWLRWGRLAALSYGRRSRPGLGLRDRLTRPTTDYAVRLGRAQYFRRLYSAFELQMLILAPPRTDKTGLLADRIISHPGPVLTTSTRPDLHLLTTAARRDRGPSFVFNPEGVGDVPSTFAWDLLGVCRDELMAYRMADWLAGATPGYGDLAWFEEQGTMGMSGLLLAAAKTGANLAEVYQWVQRRGQECALQALAGHGNAELYAVVRALMEENRTAASVRSTIARALKWAAIPQLAAAAARAGTFSAREFVLDGGTLHLIASGDSRSVITPLLRALASYVHLEAGLTGSRTEHGRLDPPLLMAMDEVAQVCPVDLPSMLADSAGKGIVFVTVAHSLSKLEERWGKEGAASIWAISGVKMLLRGITEPQTLEDVSRVCGTLGDDGDDKTCIVPPEVLRCLPKHSALVINMNLRPVVVKVRAAWKRRGYRRLSRRAGLYVPPWRLDEAVPVPELPGFVAGALPETAPVPVSANGHGGQPGSLAKVGTDD